MSQRHLDRLSSFDASFLANEGPSSPMHVGAILICQGSAPSLDEFKALIASRLDRLPRMRHKLCFPPVSLGRPLWVDDPDFDIDNHVFAVELQAPGTEDQLKALAGQIFSQPMDRSRPVWELTIVSGLEGERCAVIDKFHHAFADGIAGVDVGVVLFDLEPDVSPPAPPIPWRARSTPSGPGLLAHGFRGMLATGRRLIAGWTSALVHPRRSWRRFADTLGALRAFAAVYLRRAPPTPLNGQHGPGRRLTYARFRFEDFKAIAARYDATINDVVLAVTAGALRRWLHHRGEDPDAHELRALAPISTRREDEHAELGNRLVGMRAPVASQIAEPDERMRHVREAMRELKASKQVLAGHLIWNLNECFNDLAPPLLLKPSARINFSTRLFNLVVTNFPGPNFPLYVLGREVEDIVAYGFLARGHRLMVSIMSFYGRIAFALLADDESIADVERIAGYIDDEVAELRALLSGASPAPAAPLPATTQSASATSAGRAQK